MRLSPHGRRRLVAVALLAAALGAGYFFWLRDSSLVRVERVTVTGLDTPDASRVRAELEAAAHRMTTLHVDAGLLRRAVAGEPVVQSISVQSQFPHGLTIEVVENRPVAMLVAGTRQVAVAPDGTLLPGARASTALPAIRIGTLPRGARLSDGPARERVAVAAAAPARLLSRVESISIENGRGAVAQLQHGPAIYFGRSVELERKWAAVAAVLAQHASQGATYIDVRMPDRPVAGGLALPHPPQVEAQVAAPGATAGSPGVIPAAPSTAASGAVSGGAASAPGVAQQTQQQVPAGPSQAAAGPTQATPSTTQSPPANTGP
jgi:cell division protein FtsQ